MAETLILDELPREQSRHHLIVQRLRDAIAQGRLAVGEQLPSERELCEQLGVSRSVVREAIRVLAAQGILSVHQGRRAVVAADIARADLRPMHQFIVDTARETFSDVMDARLILEVASAERAARRADAGDLAALEAALEALRAAPPRSAAAHRAHLDFHRAIARASHNLFLARMVDALLDSLVESEPQPAAPAARGEVVPDIPLLPVGYTAHLRLYRPIQARRASAARRAMHEHLSTTIQHHPGLDH